MNDRLVFSEASQQLHHVTLPTVAKLCGERTSFASWLCQPPLSPAALPGPSSLVTEKYQATFQVLHHSI